MAEIQSNNRFGFNAAAADVNGDDKVTIADAVEVIKICGDKTNPSN